MSLTLGDEVPHIFTRKLRLRPLEILILGAKRLLQHNRGIADIERFSAGNDLKRIDPLRTLGGAAKGEHGLHTVSSFPELEP